MSQQTFLGFLLQASWRQERGQPVVQLHGRLESGEPFLVRDRREVPHFYVEQRHAEAARELGATRQQPSDRLTLDRRPVVRVEVGLPNETPALRDRLHAAGVPCYEADVRFASRFMIDRGLRSAVEIRGPSELRPGVGRVFDEPELAPASWQPRLTVLSLDIETDLEGHLLSVALATEAGSEVLLCSPPGYGWPPSAQPFPSEKDLLAGFVERLRALDPDVLTGWNVVDFDLAVLARRADALRLPFEIGRDRGALRLERVRTGRGSSRAIVPGRLVLDGIDLLRGAFIRRDDYSLDAVAHDVLGRGKLLSGGDRGEEIERLFREDRARLVEYNRVDAELVLGILERLKLIDLAVARSHLTGLTPDRVAGSIAAFDFLYLTELGKAGYVAPSVAAGATADLPTGGGHVLEPQPGLYDNVLVLDFKSLYPSVIRSFEIDPLGLVREGQQEDDPIVAPNGAAFRRGRGILPRLLDELFPRRDEAKRAGDEVASHAIKILMNSFYGVLATSACRFADPRLSNAITGFGREILLWCKRWLEEEAGLTVLYGDTDSLFVATGLADRTAARQLGERLVEQVNAALAAHLAATWRVESRLTLQLDRLYLKLHLMSLRHGTGGARKRYAGLADDGAEGKVAFTGLESVRRDATELAKQVQRGLYERCFRDLPVGPFLAHTVEELRSGLLDDQLVYRKALRKPLDAYTATTPPHVAAARKLAKPRRRGLVAYVVTQAGPEPAEERQNPFDYDHYVDKQIRPVAEPVLALSGLSFEKVIGEERQLTLFG